MDINTEIAHLMKYGSTEEIRAYFAKKRKLQKQDDFYSFFNELIDNSPYKRAEVAQRAGLSRDYVYKLLRGDKKTTERDYIIALCFALDLDILDTQHALELYPFPVLDDSDPRSSVIKAGIMTGIDLDTMNDWLEKASFPMIKTSPDMPSAEVGPARSTIFSEDVLNSLSERARKLRTERRSKMEELRRNVRMERCGCGPMDYAVEGEIEVLNDKDEHVFVTAFYGPETVLSVSKLSLLDCNDMIEEEMLEETYSDLEEAAESDYFRFFLALDKATDEKVAEFRKHMNDSRYYEGVRMGQMFWGEGNVHAELFNSNQPEYQEYYQVVRENGVFKYSMSHESAYMRGELREMFDIYFPGVDEPKYLFTVTDFADIPEKYSFAEHTFRFIKARMCETLAKMGIELPEEDSEYPKFKLHGFKELRVNVRHDTGPKGNETTIIAEITAAEKYKPDQALYISNLHGEEYDTYLTNSQSFYDAYFHDNSIIAGRTIKERKFSLEEASTSGYRDIYKKLHEAIEAYSGEGEYIWHVGDEDPLGISELL